MKSFGMLVSSTIFSALLLFFNIHSFYTKFTTDNTYYWINGFLAMVFLISFIFNMRDIINKNYETSESH
ncbi:hypothetical protein BW425_16820 [Bacillus pseudomycoides]|uniref:Uncharacterized protein n=1 Tax=Bacillus pseudomycoides TaxID=64104 RepID=A0A1Y3MG12_9BACI|nr:MULTISPECIES: hypothetical protein [Bacillus cereus group]MDF2086467.1 hypothetical protein [Bacillus pseudomycoides]OUM47811.1 hypothetical protein BW425_16820 [Bacillus pseudomycoides]PEK62058.1 hypothetical protein CN590_22285 [Bacillus pseudomycoides]PEL16858.1 hypothetical protein CN608_27080 [Bacillus pseudomycoides]PGE84689.1 hypothetical protein COM55_14600 [Bacillus pseudomycoides]